MKPRMIVGLIMLQFVGVKFSHSFQGFSTYCSQYFLERHVGPCNNQFRLKQATLLEESKQEGACSRCLFEHQLMCPILV